MDKPEQGSNASSTDAASQFNVPTTPVDNNTGSANAPGAGEFSDAMMERPSYVPEKFFKDGRINIKALAESYGELEKSRSSKPAEQTTQPPQGQTPPNSTPSPGDKSAEEKKAEGQNSQAPQIVIPGLNQASMDHYANEIQKDGKLSDASYGDLAKLGYPKTVVDAYVKGLMADAMVANAVSETKIAMTEVASITASIGGEQALSEMLQWAVANVPAADLKVYNEATGSNDPARVRMAVQGMYHAFKQAKGPDLISGRSATPSGNVEPFADADAVVRAMEDPRYSRDEAYRKQVEARIAVSNVFGQSREYKVRDSY